MVLLAAFVVLVGIVAQSSAQTVTCSLTRSGKVVRFDGSETTVGKGKTELATWNPGAEDCKFKFYASFKSDYQYTGFWLGQHASPKKYFRNLNFDRIRGKVTQKGWRCKAGCKGEIKSFDYDLSFPNGGTVYATVKEIAAGETYVVDTSLCPSAKMPNYKLTYNFAAADDEPVATLEINSKFYSCKKLLMTGVCMPEA